MAPIRLRNEGSDDILVPSLYVDSKRFLPRETLCVKYSTGNRLCLNRKKTATGCTHRAQPLWCGPGGRGAQKGRRGRQGQDPPVQGRRSGAGLRGTRLQTWKLLRAKSHTFFAWLQGKARSCVVGVNQLPLGHLIACTYTESSRYPRETSMLIMPLTKARRGFPRVAQG